MEFKPRTAGWKAQMNPLSYDGPLYHSFFLLLGKSLFDNTKTNDSIEFLINFVGSFRLTTFAIKLTYLVTRI